MKKRSFVDAQFDSFFVLFLTMDVLWRFQVLFSTDFWNFLENSVFSPLLTANSPSCWNWCFVGPSTCFQQDSNAKRRNETSDLGSVSPNLRRYQLCRSALCDITTCWFSHNCFSSSILHSSIFRWHIIARQIRVCVSYFVKQYAGGSGSFFIPRISKTYLVSFFHVNKQNNNLWVSDNNTPLRNTTTRLLPNYIWLFVKSLVIFFSKMVFIVQDDNLA